MRFRARQTQNDTVRRMAKKSAPRPSRTKAVVLSSKVGFRSKAFWVSTDMVTEPGGVTSRRITIRDLQAAKAPPRNAN